MSTLDANRSTMTIIHSPINVIHMTIDDEQSTMTIVHSTLNKNLSTVIIIHSTVIIVRIVMNAGESRLTDGDRVLLHVPWPPDHAFQVCLNGFIFFSPFFLVLFA